MKWRRSCKNTWTPTRAPTTMTSITLTWTKSSMTPMCCCPSCPPSMRVCSPWTRCKGIWRCCLTSSTSSRKRSQRRPATAPRPGRTARATPIRSGCPTPGTSAPLPWRISISPMCPSTSWARTSSPCTPCICPPWATGRTCSRPPGMWASMWRTRPRPGTSPPST